MTNGAICVNTLKRDWTSETSLCHVLAVIRCLLIVPFPESSLNDEAGKLFMDSYEEYSKRARLMADVHGRAVTVEASSEPLCNKRPEPLRSNNTTKTTAPAKKMNKKKSLKRL
jgi:hypothetical protein